MSYQPGDINKDGTAGTGADLISLLINLNDISHNQINSVVRGSTITQKDVDYLAKHVVGDQGYELPKGGIFTRSHNLGNIAIGHNAVVEHADANINSANSIAIGNGANAVFDDSIAIGKNVTTDASNQIMLGHNEHTVVIQGIVGVNTTDPTCTFDVSTNDALKVPVGTSSQRPSASLGQIRYNSELSTYEGYGAGNAWGSLGGVKDVDQDTYILAEIEPNADNDQLQFFAGGNERMRINTNGIVDISSNTALKVPVGTDAERPTGSDLSLGQIRYNTDTSTYEGYGAGNAWGSLGGVKDVDGDTKIIAETAPNADNDQLQFFTANVERMRIDASGNIGIGAEPTSSNKLIVSGDISGNAGNFTAMNVSGDISGNVGNLTGLNLTNSLKIPVGNTSERAPDVLGQIRYNTELSTYEGYGAGNAWGSLGGVKDVDGDTYILAETSATADNDALQFFTANVERMRIDASGNIGIGAEPSSSNKLLVSGDVRIEGDLSLNGVMHIIDTDNTTTEMLSITNDGTGPALTINQKGSQPVMDIQDDGTSVLYVEDGGNIGINTTTPTCRLDISSNDALKVPVGTTSQRPSASLGQIRYNTELSTYEGFGAGNAWGSLGGVKDVDGDTYILAEIEPNTDNDQLQFFAGGNERMRINTNGIVDISSNTALKVPIGTDDERPTGSDLSLGQIRYNTDTSTYEGYGAGNAWGSLGGVKDVDGDTKIIAESSAGTDNDQLQFFAGGNEIMQIDASGSVDISSNLALKIPVGTTSQRPSASLGQIRYNTDQDEFEGYGVDTTWNPLGSAIFNDNLIKSPPAIVFDEKYAATSSEIYIGWSYPTQIRAGSLNLYLPTIETFTATWSGVVNGVTKTDQSLGLNNIYRVGNTNYTIKRYENNQATDSESTNYITGIVLTNVNANTGLRYNKEFPPGSGNHRDCFVYYTGDFTSLESGSITAYYSNHQLGNNPSVHHFNIFLVAGPPSAPRSAPNVSGTQTRTVNGIDMTAVSATPIYTDGNLENNDPLIQKYRMHYYSDGDSTIRYGGAIAHGSANDPIVAFGSGASQNVFLDNLCPESTYTIVSSVQNNSTDDSFSQDSSAVDFITTNLSIPNSWSSSISLSIWQGNQQTSYHYYQSRRVYDNAIKSVKFKHWGTSSRTTGNILGTIQRFDTRGKLGKDIAKLLTFEATISIPTSYNVSNGSTTYDTGDRIVQYGGYDINTPSDETNTYIKINTNNPSEYYNNNDKVKNYYQVVNNTITIQTAAFIPSNQPTTLTAVYKQYDALGSLAQTKTISTSWFYDDYTFSSGVTTTTIGSFTISTQDSNLDLYKLCGVTFNDNSLTYQGITKIKGIGNYFYNRAQVISYSAGGSETRLTNIASGNVVNGQIIGDVNDSSYCTFTNSSLTYSNNSFNTSFSVIAYGYRPSYHVSVANKTSNTISVLMDYQNKYVYITNQASNNPTSRQTIGSNTSYYVGFRVKSGDYSSTPSLNDHIGFDENGNVIGAGADFVHDDLLTATGNKELQMANGRYRTASGTDNTNCAYLNYTNITYPTINVTNSIDYSGITAETGYRYATFEWKVNSRATAYTNVEFYFDNFQGTSISGFNTTAPTIDGSPVYAYYIFRGTYSTSWVDAIYPQSTPFTEINQNASGILQGRNTAATNSYSSNAWHIKCIGHSGVVISDTNTILQFKIALPINKYAKFSRVRARMY